MQHDTVLHILHLWPSRLAVLDDARACDPQLDLFAVHRWFQRKSIPVKYWLALLAGAKRRKIKLKSDDLVQAHAAIPDHRVHKTPSGDVNALVQGATP